MAHGINRNRVSLGSFMLGAVVGGLAGAAYALLNAPQTGEETRRQLRDVKSDFQQRAQEAAQSAKQHGKAAAAEIVSRSQNIKNEVRQAVDTTLSEGKEIVQETKAIAQKGLEDVAEDVEPEE